MDSRGYLVGTHHGCCRTTSSSPRRAPSRTTQPGAALNVHLSPANVPSSHRTVPAHDGSCHQCRRARPFPLRACPQLLKTVRAEVHRPDTRFYFAALPRCRSNHCTIAALARSRSAPSNPCPAPSMRMNDAGTPAFVSAPCIVSPSTIGTVVSASPCTMSEGAARGETKRMGEYSAASASVSLMAANACRIRCVPHRERSVGGKYATSAATRLDSLSTASEADGSPESAVVPSSSASCPPALPPYTPMRLGSTPYSPAF